MKWENNRQSDNVEDRRMGGGAPVRLGGRRGVGLGSIVIALVAGWVFGVNPLTVLGVLDGGGSPEVAVSAPASRSSQPVQDEMGRFVSAVLAGTEDVWGGIFSQAGKKYAPPKLVLFRGATSTACGAGQAAMGPFYCPADQKIYIDLSFYDTLRKQLGAPGDFAQAYVVAHEVGHHVQYLLGLTQRMDQMRQRMGEREYNAMSVRLELQADCFAGLWAHHNHRSKSILEPGDVEEALNAASAIGDDTLQRNSQGRIVPDSFTHGSSEQRKRWFYKGLESGSFQACDTFAARQV